MPHAQTEEWTRVNPLNLQEGSYFVTDLIRDDSGIYRLLRDEEQENEVEIRHEEVQLYKKGPAFL